MSSKEDVLKAARRLGYRKPELKPGGHYKVTHPKTGETVTFAATPSDHRAFENTIAQLQRSSGRKLHKPNGYSGGKTIKPKQSFLHQNRTIAENNAIARETHIKSKIYDIDKELEELVDSAKEIDTSAARQLKLRAKSLIDRRETYNATLQSLHRPTMPLDIDGVEALISENTKANIDDLKERFNA